MQLISLLRAGKYDIVMASGSSAKVCLLLALSGIPQRIGFDSGALSRFLLSRAIPLKKAQYAAFMYHDLVHGLDLNAETQLPKIDLEPAALSSMQKFLEQEQSRQKKQGQRKGVVIHPGMSRLALEKGIIKTWAAENWCKLIAQLLQQNCQVVLCGGPDDAETIQEIVGGLASLSLEAPGLFINASGKTASIQELVALMSLSDLVVCVDSAPMHIAVALPKNLVALFGPTDPKRLLPQDERFLSIRDASADPNHDVFIDGNKARGSADSASKPGNIDIPLDRVMALVKTQLDKVVKS